jgi:hypothetical protein
MALAMLQRSKQTERMRETSSWTRQSMVDDDEFDGIEVLMSE